MTIQSFIQKAIEGGWKPGTQLQSVSQYDGGYMIWVVFFYDSEGDKWHRDLASILLDPEAWKAVGKVEGWGARNFKPKTWDQLDESTRALAHDDAALYRFAHMPRFLWQGGTIESYLETL